MRADQYILGIHDGHNCGATLSRGGRILASISEERLVRRKNAVGYPALSIEAVLRIGGIEAKDLGAVVYASLFMHTASHLEDVANWYAVGIEEQRADAARSRDYNRIVFEARKAERIRQAADQLGVSDDRVHFVEHHLAHLAAAYHTAPARRAGKRVLGLTCDGAGDNLCATVSVCEGGRVHRIATTGRDASLGKIYSRVTYLMGMTPWEHEYKLMGLAPYADPERADRAAEPLRALLGLSEDGLSFVTRTELSTNYIYRHLREAFERVRFDTVAGAVQLFTEEMLVAWVRACIAHTGVADVVCGGGVFMNVKANMLMAQMPQAASLYVMPTGGDESLSIGACLHHHYAHLAADPAEAAASRLDDLYLGDADTEAGEREAIATAQRDMAVAVRQPADMNGAIAELLASGEVVAVARGRMEWGARSLGNRSILASAEDIGRIGLINHMIKMRDFWMPFAPSVREEAAPRYFEPEAGAEYRFMTMAAPAKPETVGEVAAAAHPKDGTIRPQLVTRAANPDYHAVIGAFEATTGRGAILNTSFNLHGEPIVRTGLDAVRVMGLSGIRHLALNGVILSKTDG